jgi:anaerobic ribonucleoside-triphosphate reductase activating protein
MAPTLRVNGIVEESIVDGPGLRFTVFTQGCPHKCPGCHNPQTHDASGGYDVDAETLLARFALNPVLSGVTFSGGEPFEQPEALAELAARVHALGGTVVVYTGYTIDRLHTLAAQNRAVDALLEEADILVDGPYVESLREIDSGYKGSSNQRVLDRDTIRNMRRELAEQKKPAAQVCQ